MLGHRAWRPRDPHVVLRAATTGALVAAGITLLPGRLGLSSVVWRLWWVVPAPLLLAGLVGARDGAPRRAPARPRRRSRVPGTAVAVGLLPLVRGQWVGSERNGARLATPLTCKVPKGILAEARLIESISDPGDTVLAPWDTSRVLSASPSTFSPFRLAASTSKGTPERLQPTRVRESACRSSPTGLRRRRTPSPSHSPSLSVDTACVGRSRGRAVDLLEANGFTQVGSKGTITCLRR